MADEQETPVAAAEPPDLSVEAPIVETPPQADDEGFFDITEGAEPEGDAEGGAEGEGEPKDEENPEGKEEAEPETPADPEEANRQKVERAIDEPIPQDLSARTQERIKTLIDTARNVTEERDQVSQQFQTVVGAIQMSGTTPDQFREYLQFQTNCNSNDVNRQKEALKFVMSVAQDLATAIGEPVQFKSPLEGHADLITDVQQGRMSIQRAEEVARLRNQNAIRAQMGQRQQQNQQFTQASEQDTRNARIALNAFEARMTRNDPQFAPKRQTVVNFMKQQYGAKLERLPPGQWASTFERAYRSLQLPAAPKAAPAAAAATRDANGRFQQPMRHGKRPAGNAAAAPKSIFDAVNAGIAAAGNSTQGL